jgi:FkbM family methyltransferase
MGEDSCLNDQLRVIYERAQSLEASLGVSAASATTARPPIILFGAGPLGQMTIAHLRRIGIWPVGLVDNNQQRWGTTLDGVPILAPEEAVQRYSRTGRFVVTIYNGNTVRRQLEAMGCIHISHFSDLYFEHAAEFLPFCGLAARSVILDAWAEVAAAAHVWHDPDSVKEYLAQLSWRLRLPASELPPHDPPSQCYFPTGLFEFLDDEVFLDCGAFDGDSLRQYLARRPAGSAPKILAFEPDAESFVRLANYAKILSDEGAADIHIEPWAVTERSGEVRFSALGSVRSGVAETGTATVTGVALDDVDVTPSLIKMDVEGFELPALKGAAGLLRRHRPVLAISLYHHASDLWTIPNFLRALVPDYRLFLRRYAEDCWELVLYAVPANRLLDSNSQTLTQPTTL